MTRKIIIVHIPFKLGYRASGGGIRPQKIIEAFKRLGHDVEVISGGHAERAKRFKEILNSIKSNKIKIDFIYSESPASPTMLTDKKSWWKFKDFFYLIKLRKINIPIILFYRDVHWNVKGIHNLSFLKKYTLHVLHLIDLFFYKFFVDLILLPSKGLIPFIPLSFLFKFDELPPGHDQLEDLPIKDTSKGFKGLYVGGVTPPVYDLKTLFKMDLPFIITVCCREDEWNEMKNLYGELPKNIRVVHKSGESLKQEYLNHHFFIMIRAEHLYLTMSQPIKFYEAIGFELPIMISSGSLSSKIVDQFKIGKVIEGESIEFNSDEYIKMVNNIRLLKKELTWDKRVEKIISFAKEIKING